MKYRIYIDGRELARGLSFEALRYIIIGILEERNENDGIVEIGVCQDYD